jgi:alkylation response protein AidB-like acyl-CoA dehydrogenase
VEQLEGFRKEVQAWLQENLPESMRGQGWPSGPDLALWRKRMGDRGFAIPSWPKEYYGGGLNPAEVRVLQEEMRRAGAPPSVGGFGVSMLGPVLLEYANHEQKREHLRGIVYGEVNWCQGYSEPGAGSDLASLQTRAVRDGDHYVINGSKIWTSGAQNADWMFCLVRTNTDVPKHDGISFILFDLKSEGVEVRPIQLISGASSFCQVFFRDVRAHARNLIGVENGGWPIAKRLLQHERTMLSGGMGGGAAAGGGMAARAGRGRGAGAGAAAAAAAAGAGVGAPSGGIGAIAKRYVGEKDGRIADGVLRDRVAQVEMDALCYGLTTRRSAESARSGQGPGHTSSMFKLYASEMSKRRQELMISMLGTQGLGWEGEAFNGFERGTTRQWLRSKGQTIEGGTSEVQLNVIAKRVLDLPD